MMQPAADNVRRCPTLIIFTTWMVFQVSLVSITLGQTCTSQGSSLQEHIRSSYTFGGLFINHQYPIPCDGRVVRWHFCYYPPPLTGSQIYSYSVSLGVFFSGVEIVLQRHILRDESYLYIDITVQDIASQFTCLSVEQEFDVYQGEYIGMYIEADRQNGYIKFEDVLDIVGETGNSSEYIQWEKTICQAVYQPQSVPQSCFENITGYSMHAYVEYEQSGSQTPTTQANLNPSEPKLTTDLPISSTGQSVPQTSESNPHSETTDPVTVTVVDVSQNYDSTTQTTATMSHDQPVTTSNNNQPAENEGNRGGNENVTTTGRITKTQLTIIVTLSCVALVLLVSLGVVIGAAVIRYRRHKRTLRQRRRKEHHHIGLNHFVMVTDDEQHSSTQTDRLPVAYEIPQSTIKRKLITGLPSDDIVTDHCDVTVHINPLTCTNNIIDEEKYQLLENARIGSTSSTDYNKEDHRNKQDDELTTDLGIYSETQHINRTVSSLKNSVDESFRSEYSALCSHYYKTLEAVALDDNNDDEDEEIEMFEEPANNEEALYAQVNKHRLKEILLKDIILETDLGSGQFGTVSQGIWNSYSHGPVRVAIKSLLSSRSKQIKVFKLKLLQEAAIIGQFLHPNVIQLLGVVNKKEKFMMVMELAAKGDLEKVLVSMVPDPGQLVPPNMSKALLGYCQQVAFGMQYLASKNFVHRDIAACNILVTEDNVLKIADFGMSRELSNRDYYVSQGGQIPIKWTAPEAINFKKYSTASDVWSYGCLLYEIWSLGQKPFRDYSNTEAVEKIELGYRLSPPPGCPKLIYELMIDCWHPKWPSRPLFKEIVVDLLAPDKVVLHIPPEEAASQALAGVLGGPLEAGEEMYTDLQRKYSQIEH